ncbi:MAG: hypothetical protein DLM55_03325 [Acidimicrobiales bacterium]|nr:MAG: hypothetical protein DLM55_03325 [Acidimicrobiales bacterium]
MDTTIFCYASQPGAGLSELEELAKSYLAAAERAGAADGLCVIVFDVLTSVILTFGAANRLTPSRP